MPLTQLKVSNFRCWQVETVVNLGDLIKTLAEHISDVGEGLEKADAAHNSAVGSIEARVLPSERRFKGLGVSDSEVPPMRPIGTIPRALTAPEITEDGK
jgi:DNA recombination protein RmuC